MARRRPPRHVRIVWRKRRGLAEAEAVTPPEGAEDWGLIVDTPPATTEDWGLITETPPDTTADWGTLT